MDQPTPVQSNRFADLLLEYARADDGRRLELLLRLNEMMAADDVHPDIHQGIDYPRLIAKAIADSHMLRYWVRPLADAQRKLGALFVQSVETMRDRDGRTGATFVELYAMYVVLRQLKTSYVYNILFESANNGIYKKGLLYEAFRTPPLGTHATPEQLVDIGFQRLSEAAEIPQADMRELLPFLVDEIPSRGVAFKDKIAMRIDMARAHYQSKMPVTKELFLRLVSG